MSPSMITELVKQPRQRLALLALGFPNGGIRPGIVWLVWELIFTKNW